MTKEQIIAWAIRRGWWFSQRGNLTKTWNGRTYRLKLGKRKVRHEIHVTYDSAILGKVEHDWVRLSSGFYKDLSVSDEGKLIGMKR